MDSSRRQKQVFDYVISLQLDYVKCLILKQEKSIELLHQFITYLVSQIF